MFCLAHARRPSLVFHQNRSFAALHESLSRKLLEEIAGAEQILSILKVALFSGSFSLASVSSVDIATNSSPAAAPRQVKKIEAHRVQFHVKLPGNVIQQKLQQLRVAFIEILQTMMRDCVETYLLRLPDR